MRLIYVWRSAALPPEEADRRFHEALAGECALQQSLTTLEYRSDYVCLWDAVYVGFVEPRDPPAPLLPRRLSVADELLVAGTDEHYLTSSEEHYVQDLRRILLTDPKALATHVGRFLVAAWDEQARTLILATSVTECPTAWQVEGPHGVAFGLRAGPMLALVGREPELDRGAANLYLSFSHLAGTGALYAGCHRFPSRGIAELGPEEPPRVRRSLRIREVLERNGGLSEHECGEVLVERLRGQLRHSPEPYMLLSGGRDSRLLVAAAHRAGYRQDVHTSGGRQSREVLVAGQVAQRLGLEQRVMEPRARRVGLLLEHRDRLGVWMRATEGLENLTFSPNYPALLRGEPPQLLGRQTYNGLGGEHMKGRMYPWARVWEGALERRDAAARHEAIGVALRPLRADLSQWGRDQLDHFLDALGGEADELGATAAQWLDLFYWQHHTHQWGLDADSARAFLGQRWLPLIDPRFISTCWDRPVRYKAECNFALNVTTSIAPTLGDLEYEQVFRPVRDWKNLATTTTIELAKRFGVWSPLRAGLRGVQRRFRGAERGSAGVQAWWRHIFFEQEHCVWDAFVPRPLLEAWMREPREQVTLWNLATVEAFHQSNIRCAW